MNKGSFFLLAILVFLLSSCKGNGETSTTGDTTNTSSPQASTSNRMAGIDFEGKTGIQYSGQLPKVDNMNATMFKELVESDKYVILDLRADNHYKEGHIKGAVSFPISDPKFKENIKKLDKNAAYLVYSQKGINSVKAMVALKDEDITHVINLIGGINNWVNDYNYPLVK